MKWSSSTRTVSVVHRTCPICLFPLVGQTFSTDWQANTPRSTAEEFVCLCYCKVDTLFIQPGHVYDSAWGDFPEGSDLMKSPTKPLSNKKETRFCLIEKGDIHERWVSSNNISEQEGKAFPQNVLPPDSSCLWLYTSTSYMFAFFHFLYNTTVNNNRCANNRNVCCQTLKTKMLWEFCFGNN